MGASVTLLQKEFIELSIEIDRDISLELGTGFGTSGRVTTSINVPLTIDELQAIIMAMQRTCNMLKMAWKCEECGTLNHPEDTDCFNCESDDDSTI